MGIVVGGEEAVWRRVRGDWFACGQYIELPDGHGTEPAMVLFPRNPSRLRGAHGLMQPACIIALSVAFKYDDPVYLAAQASKFAEGMGKDTKDAKFALAELIHGSLLDLIKMPPQRPSKDVKAVAEITVKAHGQTFHHEVKE